MAKKTHRLAALTIAAALIPLVSVGSSHREAPNITRMPAVDSTDFYMFNSYEPGREGYVTMIANYIPLQDPYGGPNYFPLDATALYEIVVDTEGDAVPDLSFAFLFKNKLGNQDQGIALGIDGKSIPVPLKNVGPVGANNTSLLNFDETYTLTVRRGGNVSEPATNVENGSATFTKPYDFVGTKTFGSIAGYEAYVKQFIYDINIPGCDKPGRVFVGQRHESFSVNLGKIFDLVNLVPVDGSVFPGGIKQDPRNNELADKNITSIAIEMHSSCLKGKGNGVIGAWTRASLPQSRVLYGKPTFDVPEVDSGPFVQVSRLSNPLVNEVVIGLPDKDRFNASAPQNDGQFAKYVTNPSLPALLNALFLDPVNATLKTHFVSIAPSNIPRNDLVAAFLTGFKGLNQQAHVTPSEMQRLNMGVPATPAAHQSTFGVAGGDLAGFPNGRRPGDDVVDIALRVVMGRLCYPVPIAGKQTDLGLCTPADAPVGMAPFTDGAPISSADFDTTFPYLRTPIPGSMAVAIN